MTVQETRKWSTLGPARVLDTPFNKQVAGVPDSDITIAVSEALQGGVIRGERLLSSGMFAKLTESLDVEATRTVAPPWFNLTGFVRIVAEASLVRVPTGERTPSSAADTDAAAEPTALRAVLKDLGDGDFGGAGRAAVNGLMGAVVGSNIRKILSPTVTTYTPDLLSVTGRSLAYDAALEIGDFFSGPPSSPDDLLERIKLLIPKPAEVPTRKDLTLFNIFIKHRAFDSHSRPAGKRCPAIGVVDALLSSWGEVMSTDGEYRQKVLTAVQN